MMVAQCAPPVNRGWAKIPHAVTFDKSLTPTAKSVLAVLLYFAKSRSHCDPTDEQIGECIDRSRRTVSVCLRALEAAGLIRREAAPKRNVAGRVIHLTVEDGGAVAKPVEARSELPTSPLQTAEPQAANRVPPSGEPRSSCGRSSVGDLEKKEEVEDAPTIVQSLKPETVEVVADRLIAVFRDDVTFRGKYVRLLRRVVGGEIPMAKAEHAAREAVKRSKGRGLAFLSLLESTTPLPAAKAKPRTDSPEVAGLLAQARSGEERARNSAVGSLLGLGFSLDELRDLFAAAPTSPAPVAPCAEVSIPDWRTWAAL